MRLNLRSSVPSAADTVLTPTPPNPMAKVTEAENTIPTHPPTAGHPILSTFLSISNRSTEQSMLKDSLLLSLLPYSTESDVRSHIVPI